MKRYTRSDFFGRYWHDRRGNVALRAEAWGRDDRYSERGPHSGLRLYCSASSLKRILKKYDKNLLLLLSLERYEKEGYNSGRRFGHTVAGVSGFRHTVAAIRISKTLDVEYFKGRVNYLHDSRN